MNERNRHIALADDVTAMKKQFKGITDVGKAVDKIMRLHQRLVKLNLNHLISADIDEDDDGEG
jgi:predicted YcjX-like family ATPase